MKDSISEILLKLGEKYPRKFMDMLKKDLSEYENKIEISEEEHAHIIMTTSMFAALQITISILEIGSPGNEIFNKNIDIVKNQVNLLLDSKKKYLKKDIN
jgi:hypothetical protein